MPRPLLPRRIGQRPQASYYKPAGVPLQRLQEVVLSLDEMEALRLVDLEGLYQEAAAERMQISRPTLSRILTGAHRKVAMALVEGQALKIEGGVIQDEGVLTELSLAEPCPGPRCGHEPRGGRRRRGQVNTMKKPRNRAMKIVITAESGAIDAAVNPQFGRAASYILYDMETNDWSAHDNAQNVQAEQGAGVQAAQTIIGLGPAAVVTGQCGPKAFRALQAAGLDIYTGAHGTVRDAVEALREGRLQKAEVPNAGSHAGKA